MKTLALVSGKIISTINSHRLFLLAVMAAVLSPWLFRVGYAHTPATSYVTREWYATTQHWHFTSGFWGTQSMRDRIWDGLSFNSPYGTHGPNWNYLGLGITFYREAEEPDHTAIACDNPIGYNGVHRRDIEASGEARTCVSTTNPNKILNTQMVLDQDAGTGYGWYTGTGDSPNEWVQTGWGQGYCSNITACKMDTWSVAAHEWGHMFGYSLGADGGGHFVWPDAEGTCSQLSNDPNEATMCKFIIPGSDHKRTTEPHDRHTIQAAYWD